MKRALHLMADHVFTRDFIDDTRILGINTHDFLIYTTSIGKEFVKPGKNIFLHHYGSSKYNSILKKLGTHYTHLFVHWLSYESGEAVINAPTNVKVGAFFWGNDFAEPTSMYKHRVFDPLTLKYFETVQSNRKVKWRNNPRWRYALKPIWLFKTIINKLSGTKGTLKLFEKKKEAIARLDYFLHFNKYDLAWVNEQTPTKALLIPFFYAAGYQDASQVKNENSGNNKIILGNSASITNNHVDVLKKLSDVGISAEVEVVVPLSYGDKSYGAYVTEQGKMWLGKGYIPLTDFMQREEYFKLLSETTCAIFNVKRTQALGNINAMLAMGKKVFLNSACPMFQFYNEHGFVVYDVEKAYASPSSLCEKLESTKALTNRNKLEEYFSETLRLQYLKDILEFKVV